MTVTEAVLSRRSVRAFLDAEPPFPLLKEILTKASRAASGGNVQPWKLYVVTGEPLRCFKSIMTQRLAESPGGEVPVEYEVYPKPLKAPYRDYRYKNAEDYYGLVGIPREDKAAGRDSSPTITVFSKRRWRCFALSTGRWDLRSGPTWECIWRR